MRRFTDIAVFFVVGSFLLPHPVYWYIYIYMYIYILM